MNKNHVLLVAVGGIGFRHFQALLNCRSDFELHVVDISEAAVERARSYEKEQESGRTVHYYTSISEIESSIGFRIAIIATSSLIRRTVFEELIARYAVEMILFEKVLFPRVKDYEEVGAKLKENHISAYVNCTRRVHTIYQELRDEVRRAKRIHAQIKGGNWGLACNSIHIVDLFAYLSSDDLQAITCNGTLLENQIFESKREGYIEFYGKLTGKIGKKTTYLIECGHDDTAVLIELFTDKAYYCIDEDSGRMTVQSLNGGELMERYFEISYVSQTTAQVVDMLLQGQPVELTSYEESAMLHIPILREFLKKRNEIQGKEDEVCLIT